jgi:hypothetical protein
MKPFVIPAVPLAGSSWDAVGDLSPGEVAVIPNYSLFKRNIPGVCKQR